MQLHAQKVINNRTYRTHWPPCRAAIARPAWSPAPPRRATCAACGRRCLRTACQAARPRRLPGRGALSTPRLLCTSTAATVIHLRFAAALSGVQPYRPRQAASRPPCAAVCWYRAPGCAKNSSVSMVTLASRRLLPKNDSTCGMTRGARSCCRSCSKRATCSLPGLAHLGAHDSPGFWVHSSS